MQNICTLSLKSHELSGRHRILCYYSSDTYFENLHVHQSFPFCNKVEQNTESKQ